jgi:hypothetical protein
VSDLLTAVLLLPPFLATGHRLPSRIEVEAHCRRAATAPDSSFELLYVLRATADHHPLHELLYVLRATLFFSILLYTRI